MRTFNSLLEGVGIAPSQVRLLRHHTRGIEGRTPFTLWRDDRAAFERYQSTQRAGRLILRDAPYWASFVSPAPGETMFVGLYQVQHVSSGPVEWPCPLRGGVVGEGRPYDLFDARLMAELSDQIGRLRVAWDPANVRTWIRYAEGMNLPVSGFVDSRNSGGGSSARSGAGSMGSEELAGALIQRGFEVAHATSKVRLLRREDLALYVKQGTDRLPLIIHPYFDACLAEIGRIPGVELDRPTAYYVNSNLREFPAYAAEHRRAGSASISRLPQVPSMRCSSCSPGARESKHRKGAFAGSTRATIP